MKLEFSYEPNEFTKAMRKLQVLVILSKKKNYKVYTPFIQAMVLPYCVYSTINHTTKQ